MNYISRINNNFPFIGVLIFMFSILVLMSLLIFFPVYVLVLDMTFIGYIKFITGIYYSSGIIFHIYISIIFKIISKTDKTLTRKRESFLDFISMVSFNVTISPIAGIIFYQITNDVLLSVFTFVLFFIAAKGWLHTINELRAVMKEKDNKLNKWVDEEGNTHFKFNNIYK
ncbi:hypothetical protein KGF86_01825 [Ornithinibacillus massiliensis]|uniref:Uncharacterized protein n=2 Tax=Ornithinibacillus massiliensis TaxID=1944633 RepID=A0ABS5MA21_9BACI|nr:hypothetical protein [Ornithinibacillus massiliensis]